MPGIVPRGSVLGETIGALGKSFFGCARVNPRIGIRGLGGDFAARNDLRENGERVGALVAAAVGFDGERFARRVDELVEHVALPRLVA